MTQALTPPQRLRHELERLRDRGASFTGAWPIAQSRALEGENVHVAVWWRETWASQKPIWLCSYSRVAWPRSVPALTTFDTDHSRAVAPTPPLRHAA